MQEAIGGIESAENLIPRINTFANTITTRVAKGELDPAQAADDIAEMIRAALAGDTSFETLLDLSQR
ncbi:MAG: hypothetical protein QM647_00070 [Asticcacaulis sp.]|uniref:hypothetical protein n=1 Tax=Asticcacaulis sp. TaxID=1872648 RepID=UPI0039E249A7